MKKIVFIIAFFINLFSGFSQPVSVETVREAAQAKIFLSDWNRIAESPEKIFNQSDILILYKVELKPSGYILFQTDRMLEPVLAYSTENSLNEQTLNFFINDATERLLLVEQYKNKFKNNNPEQWENLISKKSSGKYEQWPPQGTTSTGGWLESNWHQSSPYNTMCPYDNAHGARSVAGCPAIAASMIINYHKELNGTIFNDDDDYHHSFNGNSFDIDDDYFEFKFPHFDSLNVILDSIQERYDAEESLSNYEKAGLVFACGTAAKQVYSSQVSGTYSVNQARDLYLKFGFEGVLLYTELSDEMYDTLIFNMKNAYPAHLAVVDAQEQYGHNVVVDGYNTDNFFHINFGWGGSSNGWWNIPDDDFPYGMNVLEGIIVNINYTEQPNQIETLQTEFNVFPNPGNGQFTIAGNTGDKMKLEVFSTDGKLISSNQLNSEIVNLPLLKKGMYILKLYNENKVYHTLYLVK